MKTMILGIFTALLFLAQTATADDHNDAASPVEFWGCKFNENYDMQNITAWYKKFNKQVDTYKDQSYSAYVMTPMFSNEMDRVDFVIAGSWGSLASMGSGMQEFFGDGKGNDLFAELQSISTCNSHTLYMSQQVRAAKG